MFTRAGRTDRDRDARKRGALAAPEPPARRDRQDIRRDALSQTVDAAEADRIALRLEDFGVLRLDEVEREGRGRPVKRWLVNPRLRDDEPAPARMISAIRSGGSGCRCGLVVLSEAKDLAD